MLSNALIGLSGALICQSQKYADIGMGTGAIVIGLAAIVIGEVLGRLLPGGLTQFSVRLASAVFGSVVYFLIRAIVLQLGMDANDMKLLSAVMDCRGPVRARGLGALQAPQLLHEGR